MKRLFSPDDWKSTFFVIWTGQAVSQFTSSVLQFAIVWYLTDQTGSAMVLTLAMMMGFLPQGILGLVVGVLIDRYSRKHIMIIADLLIAAAGLMMAAAAFLGMLSTSLILVVLLLRSVGAAFHHPCLQAVTPQIVPTDQLARCSGYSQALESVSQILSPAAAAVLYGMWHISGIIFLDILGALLAVLALSITVIPTLSQEEKGGKSSFFQEAKEGFRILRSNPGMLGLVWIGSLYTLAMMPTSALFPLMCMSYFGGSSIEAGLVEAVFSLGLLLGSIVLAKLGGTGNRVTAIIGSFLLMSVSLLISGMLPPEGFNIFIVCSLLMGISGPFYWGSYTPLLQSSFEAKYLGRVLSVTGSIRLLSGPVGLAVSGVWAGKYGVSRWFLIAGGLVLLAAFLCMVIPKVRHCDLSYGSSPGSVE